MSQMVSQSQQLILARKASSALPAALILVSTSALLEHIVTSSQEHHKVVAASNAYMALDATGLQWILTISAITVALMVTHVQLIQRQLPQLSALKTTTALAVQ